MASPLPATRTSGCLPHPLQVRHLSQHESSRRPPPPSPAPTIPTPHPAGYEAHGNRPRAAYPREVSAEEEEVVDRGLLKADDALRAARRRPMSESPALSVATAQDQELQNALRMLQRSRADALEQLQVWRGDSELTRGHTAQLPSALTWLGSFACACQLFPSLTPTRRYRPSHIPPFLLPTHPLPAKPSHRRPRSARGGRNASRCTS